MELVQVPVSRCAIKIIKSSFSYFYIITEIEILTCYLTLRWIVLYILRVKEAHFGNSMLYLWTCGFFSSLHSFLLLM